MYHYILFSGGFDSTYTLYKACKETKEKNPEDTIVTVSFDVDLFGEEKQKREKTARENIIKYMKNKFPEIKLKTMEVDMDLAYTIGAVNNTGLAQLGLLTSLFGYIVSICNNTDKCELIFSYIKDDCSTRYLNNIETIINNLFEFQPTKKKPSIIFPLWVISKKDILKKLIKIDKDLFNLCTYCESIDNDKCGTCAKCIETRDNLSLLKLYHRDEFTEDELKFLDSKVDC